MIRIYMFLIVGLMLFMPAIARSPFQTHGTATRQRPDFVPPDMTKLSADVKPFEYVDVGSRIPNYFAGQGHTLNLMQQPLPAAESLLHMVTPVGFHVELFADESILTGKPITLNWDERGRLWVGETVDYPHGLNENNRGNDQLRILSDTNGDGRADQSTIFADQLNIPTAIAFHRGGVVVQNGTETLYLKDTDGDDVADVRKVLIAGWGLDDTHGGVSNFRNGLDNWIWAMQGYNNSAPVYNGKSHRSFRQGFFRFKLSQADPPTVEQLEFIRSTTNNTWGLGISEEGLIFGSTANRAPSFFMPIANRYYERVKGWAPETLQPISDTHLFHPITDKIRQVDHFGGYTAGAGHALYTARKFPPAWWNRTAFVCGPTGKLVGTFVLKPEGAGFRSSNPINLLASNDEWTAPIMAEVGPDGNVWVIDWYTYIVQHNPTPQGFETGRGEAYATDLREHKYGRIYRVVYGDPIVSTEGAAVTQPLDATQLVRRLADPTMLNRLTAQRLLIERGQSDIVPELLKLFADQSVDEIGLNVGAIHALHTLSGLRQLDSADCFAAVVQALSHPSPGVRLNAIRVLPPTEKTAHVLLGSQQMLVDGDAQVELAFYLKLSDLEPNLEVGKFVCLATNQKFWPAFLHKQPIDRWLRDALTAAGATHADGFLQTYSASETFFNPESLPVARRIAEHFARSQPSAAQMEMLLTRLMLIEQSSAIVEGWQAGWPSDYQIMISDTANENLKLLFKYLPNHSKAALIGLTAHWGTDVLEGEVAAIAENLLAEIREEANPISQRLTAANRLIELDPNRTESVAAIEKLIGPLTAPQLSAGLVRTISRSTVPDLGARLVRLNATATPAIRDAVMEVMLARPKLTQRLLDAISAGEMRLSDLTVHQRQMLVEHPDTGLRKLANEVIEAGGAAVNSDRAHVVMAKMDLTEQAGDIVAGKEVFKKNCGTCHVYKGEGQTVGPNLTGMSVHPKGELLTHILDPSRGLEANYRLYTVLTLDGLLISGILAGESQTSIEMIDDKAVRHTILREDIDELKPSQKSAMPEGLETSVSDQGLIDLLEYLTEKDKFIPIPLDRFATVITTRGMFYDPANEMERLVFDDWTEKKVEDVPFLLIDPRSATSNNAILLHSTKGATPPKMPKSVTLPCRTPAIAIHLLGGVAGWAAKVPGDLGTSLIVRLHYADGNTEDHALIDGQHIADYIGLYDVPKSKLAFDLHGRQLRYLSIIPQRSAEIATIELVKPDSSQTAPIVMAITVERAEDVKRQQK